MHRSNHPAQTHNPSGLVPLLIAVSLGFSACNRDAPQSSPGSGQPPPPGKQYQATPGDPKLIGFYTAIRIGNATAVVDLEDNNSDGKGVISAAQVSALKSQPCTLTVYTNHTLIVSNFPSPISPTRLIDIPGIWSLKAYQIMDAHRFQISISGGTEVKLVRASSPADTLDFEHSPFLDVYCQDARGQGLNPLFKKIRNTPGPALQN
jgi:hypothetical protein